MTRAKAPRLEEQPARAWVEVGHHTLPDSRSNVAHAAWVQLSHRSWMRLSTLRHSRGTCRYRRSG